MDILLINPYYSQPLSYHSFYRPTAPMGLMYLAGYLRRMGLSVEILETGIFDVAKALRTGRRVRFGLSDDEIVRRIATGGPKIVGITCMYSIYYRDVVEIAHTIKRADPRIQVVLGGNHASSYGEHLLKDPHIDFVVFGEGEATFLELSRQLLKGGPVAGVKGLIFRDGEGRIVKNAPRDMIKDLDAIPFPAMDAVDYRRYLGEGNPFTMRPPAAGILSSRGCPGQCIYCTVQAVWGRTWRGRSPKNVADEIEHITRTYGVKEFAFLDDSASVDRERWDGICNEIIRRKLDIKWTTPNGIAHWTLTTDILDKMKRAGCYRITLGIESGDTETRKFLGKPYPLSQARDIIRHANRIGMWTITTNIIGFPYETAGAIRKTLQFAKESGTDFACFYLLMPQPTSRVYDVFKKERLLDFDDFLQKAEFDEVRFEEINYILNETGSDTRYFRKEELGLCQKKAYRSFIIYRAFSYLFHPWRLAWKMRSTEDLRYVFSLLAMGLGIFLRTLNTLNKKSSDYLYSGTKTRIGR